MAKIVTIGQGEDQISIRMSNRIAQKVMSALHEMNYPCTYSSLEISKSTHKVCQLGVSHTALVKMQNIMYRYENTDVWNMDVAEFVKKFPEHDIIRYRGVGDKLVNEFRTAIEELGFDW